MISKRISTLTIAIAIVTLLVGLGIGIAAQPYLSPIAGKVITQKEYDEYQQIKATRLQGEIKLGFLGSLTGRLASYGENELTAAQFAATQVNTLLTNAGMNWTIKIVAEDTQTSPTACLQKVELFNSQGIKLLIGPLSSAELVNIKGYCDSNKILTISQSSTVPSLSIKDDYIFRFAPTDVVQGRAIARMMWDDGKKYVISATANDPWGIELKNTAKQRFENLTGTWVYDLVYSTTATEFSSEASILATQVQNAITAYGADKVAVLNIGFEEVATIFIAADAYPVLSTVKWYGSDGTALAAAITSDTTAAKFAIKTVFPNTIFSPTETSVWKAVRQNNIAELGREPDSYSYGCYDIVWAYAKALMIVDTYNAELVKKVLPDVARGMFGALGWINLDDSGDLVAQNYNIWKVIETGPGVYAWVQAGVYNKEIDTITWT